MGELESWTYTPRETGLLSKSELNTMVDGSDCKVQLSRRLQNISTHTSDKLTSSMGTNVRNSRKTISPAPRFNFLFRTSRFAHCNHHFARLHRSMPTMPLASTLTESAHRRINFI
jgi:hypothetical protein